MDESRPVAHHTVTSKKEPKARRKDKGIIWPARHLARDIGSRPPGSPGERSASRFVEQEFRITGIKAEPQAFRTPSTTAWSESIAHLLLVAGVLCYFLSNHLSYALVCLGFLLFLLEEYGRSPLSWLQPHRRSNNVVASISPHREPVMTVVLIAHMDSPRSSFYYRPGLARLFRTAFLVDFACQACVFMIFSVIYGGSLLKMGEDKLLLLWKLGAVFIIPPALALLGLLYKAILGRSTPGGNDNSSGIAVLLQLARVYSRRRPHNTELWFVSTGASDAGGLGVRHLIRKNRSIPRGAYFIVLDQVGRGHPVCYRREGRLIPFRANRHLLSLAKRISNIHAHYGVDIKRNCLYISEGFQLLSRGRKAITVSSREESRYTRFWRWPKDDYDNIDPRTLRLTADFVQAMVDNIDRGNLKKK